MAEQVDLTVPETKPNNTLYKLDRVLIDVNGIIQVWLKGLNGEVLFKEYNFSTTPTGLALLSALNTSNNSAGTSLIKRIYNRLITDSVITGTVSGTAV